MARDLGAPRDLSFHHRRRRDRATVEHVRPETEMVTAGHRARSNSAPDYMAPFGRHVAVEKNLTMQNGQIARQRQQHSVRSANRQSSSSEHSRTTVDATTQADEITASNAQRSYDATKPNSFTSFLRKLSKLRTTSSKREFPLKPTTNYTTTDDVTPPNDVRAASSRDLRPKRHWSVAPNDVVVPSPSRGLRRHASDLTLTSSTLRESDSDTRPVSMSPSVLKLAGPSGHRPSRSRMTGGLVRHVSMSHRADASASPRQGSPPLIVSSPKSAGHDAAATALKQTTDEPASTAASGVALSWQRRDQSATVTSRRDDVAVTSSTRRYRDRRDSMRHMTSELQRRPSKGDILPAEQQSEPDGVEAARCVGAGISPSPAKLERSSSCVTPRRRPSAVNSVSHSTADRHSPSPPLRSSNRALPRDVPVPAPRRTTKRITPRSPAHHMSSDDSAEQERTGAGAPTTENECARPIPAPRRRHTAADADGSSSQDQQIVGDKPDQMTTGEPVAISKLMPTNTRHTPPSSPQSTSSSSSSRGRRMHDSGSKASGRNPAGSLQCHSPTTSASTRQLPPESATQRDLLNTLPTPPTAATDHYYHPPDTGSSVQYGGGDGLVDDAVDSIRSRRETANVVVVRPLPCTSQPGGSGDDDQSKSGSTRETTPAVTAIARSEADMRSRRSSVSGLNATGVSSAHGRKKKKSALRKTGRSHSCDRHVSYSSTDTIYRYRVAR